MKIFVLFFALAVSTGAWLPGQATSARIYGNVQNDEEESLAGVEVTAVNVVNNAETKVFTSGSKGAFSFLGLAPGIYQVSFDMSGYQSHVASGIQLSADQSATLRIKLHPLPAADGVDPGPGAEAPPIPDAVPWKTWQVELGAGAFYARPTDLNRFIERDRWFLRSLAVHYMSVADSINIGNSWGAGTGVLLPLGGTQPLTARLRFSINRMFSLAAGVSWSDRQQVSESSLAYYFTNPHSDINSFPGQFSIVSETGGYRLGVEMAFPHLGGQASLMLNPTIRLAAFAHAGWAFAECRHASMIIFHDGALGQVRIHELAMKGRGDGAAIEAGAKLEIEAWRGLGVFVEGGYLLGRVTRVTGESSMAATVQDAKTQAVLSRSAEHMEGQWLLTPDTHSVPFIPMQGDVSLANPFRLDLGGGGFRAGLFFRF